MKKRILSIALAMTMLAGCSDGKKEKAPEETKPIFFSSNRCSYGNGVVFGYENATYLDFDTMEKAPLCAMPNCVHDNGSCLARIIGAQPVFYNDYVYYFTSNNGAVRETPDGREFYIESKLWRASLESSETELVCEFTDCAPEQGLPDTVLYGNELYFIGDDLDPTNGPDGIIASWSNAGGYHYLCSINLDTGEYTNYGSITDEDKQYEFSANSSGANITGVYNDTMYIGYGFIKEEPDDLTTADIENYTFLSFEFDFETKSWKKSELPFSRYMNNDTYTYYDYAADELHVIHEKGELVIPSDGEITQMSEFNGKLFIYYYSVGSEWYDLSDGSKHSMGKYDGYDVLGYYDGCYILAKGGRTAKITEEELLALE